MVDDVGKLPAGHEAVKVRRLAVLEMIAAGCWHPAAFEMMAGVSFDDRAGLGNNDGENRQGEGDES